MEKQVFGRFSKRLFQNQPGFGTTSNMYPKPDIGTVGIILPLPNKFWQAFFAFLLDS
jgi:hypothetical protein